MIWLILGVVIWSCIHFIPTLGQPFRQKLINSIGKHTLSNCICTHCSLIDRLDSYRVALDATGDTLSIT